MGACYASNLGKPGDCLLACLAKCTPLSSIHLYANQEHCVCRHLPGQLEKEAAELQAENQTLATTVAVARESVAQGEEVCRRCHASVSLSVFAHGLQYIGEGAGCKKRDSWLTCR